MPAATWIWQLWRAVCGRIAIPSDNGDAIVLRNATKNLVYALVNSNAMNAKVIGYDEPLWHSYLLYVNVGLGCIMGIWGVLAFVHAFKLKKKLKEQK